MPRAPRRVGPLLVALALVGSGEAAAQTPEFADWTASQGGVASGTLRGSALFMSGSNVAEESSVLDGSSTVFSTSAFTPPLPASDAIYFGGAPGFRYTLAFGAPAHDPVVHVSSLASRLGFPPGTHIERVSGDDRLAVSGNTVTGAVSASTDANGTFRLLGDFESISFTADPVFSSPGEDGIYLQVGSDPTPPPPPPPAPPPPPPPPTIPPPVGPQPIAGESVVSQVVSGTVRARTPGGAFVPLDGTDSLPVGTVVDARQGSLTFRTVADAAGGIGEARLDAGMFAIRQARAAGEIATEFVLQTPPGLDRACASRRTRPAKGVVRRLRLTAIKGVFRTVAARAVVTGRNATWTSEDRCDGTLTNVRRGRVSVRAARRTVTVRPGRAHLVKARLFGARLRRR